jgi:hypothetical protein
VEDDDELAGGVVELAAAREVDHGVAVDAVDAADAATARSPTAKLSSLTARQAGTTTVLAELAVLRTKEGILWPVGQLWIEPFVRRVAFPMRGDAACHRLPACDAAWPDEAWQQWRRGVLRRWGSGIRRSTLVVFSANHACTAEWLACASRREMMIRKEMARIAAVVTILTAASCASRGDDLGSTIDDPGSGPATSALVASDLGPRPGNTPAAKPPATKITIKSTQPLALVAYREVTDPVWHLATEKTSGKFVAQVRGPYWVTTVCHAAQPGTPVLFTQVWRGGRALDDAHEIEPPFLCVAAAPRPLPEVTGVMVQAGPEFGAVALSSAQFSAEFTGSTDKFPFSLLVPKGTYTMYGFDDDRIAIRPNIVVDRSLSVLPVDLTTEGSPYTFASFNVLNTDPFAFVHAVTRIEDASGVVPFQLASGPLPGKVVPNEAMTTDNQTVSVQADVFTFDNNIFRQENVSSRRPWRLGDDPTFVEPAQITGAAWSFDGSGQLIASWQALPAQTIHTTEVFGLTPSGDFVDDFTEMSPAFLAATGTTSTLVDTSIPDFDPGWIIDYNSTVNSYSRDQFSQNVTNLATPEHAPIFTSDITETVFPQSQLASREAMAARPAQPHMPRLPGMPYPR